MSSNNLSDESDESADIDADDEDSASLYTTLQELSGARFTEINHARDVIDLDFLRLAREKGIALPSGRETKRDKFHGGLVGEPKPGRHENVLYTDVSAMYPNIMRQCNMSPETLVGTAEELEASVYTEDDCVWSYVDMRPVKNLDSDELYSDFTPDDEDDEVPYKIVYDPNKNNIKWRDSWESIQEHMEKLYFIHPDIQEGFIASRADDYIVWNKQYTGTLYDATKQQRNCFTPDTDVMTPDGVRNIRNLEVGDEVYSIDPDTLEVETKPVTETHEYPDYDGDVIDIETSKVDLSVTPNHRMLVRKDNNNDSSWDEYRFVEAGDMDTHSHYELPHDWQYIDGEYQQTFDLTDYLDEYSIFVDPDVHGHTFAAEIGQYPERTYRDKNKGYVLDAETFQTNREYIESVSDELYIHKQKGRKWVPATYNYNEILQLIGWYITEGSLNKSQPKQYDNRMHRGESNRIDISKRNDDEREQISDLLDSLDIDHGTDESGLSFSSDAWWSFLHDYCGMGSENKSIPEFVYECGFEQKQLFFDTLIDGDGDSGKGRYRYSTKSKQLRDDVGRLCVHLGKTPQFNEDSGIHRVYYSDSKNTVRMNRSSERRESDNGVYCVTVADNHTLMAGRNGKFQWVGQSLYGVNGDTNWRMFNWKVAEAVCLAGRLILTHSMDAIQNHITENTDIDETYACIADTDGFGLTIPGAATRGHAFEITENAVEWINGDGYDEYVSETFGTDEHYTEIDIESYSPSLFVPQTSSGNGVGKTYAKWTTVDEGEECDEISITGFECERSDIADITEEIQKYILEIILRNDTGVAKETVFPYLRDVQERFEAAEEAASTQKRDLENPSTFDNHDIDLADIGQRSGMSKHCYDYGTENRRAHPTYRGAKYAHDYIEGENFESGGKPYKFYVSSIGCDEHPSKYGVDTGENDGLSSNEDSADCYAHYGAEQGDDVDVISVEDIRNIPDCATIDYDTHFSKTVEQPVRQILFAIGSDWSDVKLGHDQGTLGDFE